MQLGRVVKSQDGLPYVFPASEHEAASSFLRNLAGCRLLSGDSAQLRLRPPALVPVSSRQVHPWERAERLDVRALVEHMRAAPPANTLRRGPDFPPTSHSPRSPPNQRPGTPGRPAKLAGTGHRKRAKRGAFVAGLVASIGVDGDSSPRSGRFDQLQVERSVSIEQLLSAADHRGIDQEHELVDEIVLEQRRDQLAAAPDADLVVPLFQVGDLSGDVAVEHGGVGHAALLSVSEITYLGWLFSFPVLGSSGSAVGQ